MKNKVLRKLFLGFMHIHILHHGSQEPFYGSWMIEELKEHGYDVSPGTLYPLLHKLEEGNLLTQEQRNVNGSIRKYYVTTPLGEEALIEARNKAKELFEEIK
jgi:DNA-binding PadR family transcriptional regulator